MKTVPSLVEKLSPAGPGPRKSDPPGSPAILGESPGIAALRADLERIAASVASTILILGETGTGKELVARAIHDRSTRASGQYVVVNCSALPAGLVEEEFFGHEAGAYTDARGRKPGLLEVAHGGTLFLDEIGELDLGMQAKFLRFLEDGRVRRLGGTYDQPVDVRFVAATNVDMEDRVRAERFRKDLYYRLQVVTLRVPALRERRDDIALLARHFMEFYSARFHKEFSGLTPAALRALEAYDWPGNVRELRNAVERAVLLESGPLLDERHLTLGGRKGAALAVPPLLSAQDDLDLGHIELNALVRALERCQGNISRAARLLGVSRDTVRYRMKRDGIRVETRVTIERPEGPPRKPDRA